MDIYPSTAHLMCLTNGHVSATLRLSEYSSSELAQNQSYSFSESASNMGGKSVLIDLIFISSELMGTPLFVTTLLRMALTHAINRKFQNVFILAPDKMKENLLELGFSDISEPFFSPNFKKNITPMKLRVADFSKGFESVFKDRELLQFQEVIYFTCFLPGEVMAIQGDKGSTAFLIHDGEVDVVLNGVNELVCVAKLNRGSLIGEIGLLTGERRTASLVAATSCACITFARTEFIQKIFEEPARAVDLFRIFSKRLATSNQKLASYKKEIEKNV